MSASSSGLRTAFIHLHTRHVHMTSSTSAKIQRNFLTALLLLVALGAHSATFAQVLPASPEPREALLDDPTSKAAVREMVATLSDDSVRALLIQRLDAVAEAHERATRDGDGAWGVLTDAFGKFAQHARHALAGATGMPETLGVVSNLISGHLQPRGLGGFLLIVAGGLLLGLVAERAVARFFRRRKQALIDEYATTLWGILRIIYTRLSFDILGVLAFAGASLLWLRIFYGPESIAGHMGYGVTAALMGGGLAYVIARFYFAPGRPDLRIC